jgi:hypothetical protein
VWRSFPTLCCSWSQFASVYSLAKVKSDLAARPFARLLLAIRARLASQDGRSPRAVAFVTGKVQEHGMPRLFRRLTEGVFDEDDVRARCTSWPFFELRARRMASRCRSRSAIPTGKHRGMA